MAIGWPMKTTYADGDVYSASDVNDITGTINLLGSSVAYAAGKNKIINGDFFINQRNFTSVTNDGFFTFDRWKIVLGGPGTLTATPQTFTPGAAPVAGYESRNFIQLVTASTSGTSDYKIFLQPIEDVRTFAGQTATLSFWAKAGSGTPKMALELVQNFGSGGSPSANVNTYGGQVILSTSWTRYSVTVSVPSISGKTIGTTANTSSLITQFWLSAGSDFNSRTGSLGLQNATFQIWGVQVEQGSTATAFQTATGTIQGELAACKRYFQKTYGENEAIGTPSTGSVIWTQIEGTETSRVLVIHQFPVEMRTSPTVTGYGAVSGSSGVWYNRSVNADRTITSLGTYPNGIAYNTISGTNSAGQQVLVCYTASAEL